MTKTYAPKQATTRGHSVQISNIEMYYEEYGTGKPLVLSKVPFTSTALRFLDGTDSN